MCSKYIRWLLKSDLKGKLKFATLNSDFRRSIIKEYSLDSIIYYRNNKKHFKSDAIVEIAKDLKPIFFLANILYLIPKKIRDHAYDFIARRRKRMFSNATTCELIPLEYKDRFIN